MKHRLVDYRARLSFPLDAVSAIACAGPAYVLWSYTT